MSRPGSIETASVTRLRTIILVDIGTALAATVFMIVVRLTVVPSSYLALAAVLVALSGAVMARWSAPAAQRRHRRGFAVAGGRQLEHRHRRGDDRHVLLAADDAHGVVAHRFCRRH